MNQNEYIRLSLELHLFFDRIMKEHSFFLEAGFMEKDRTLKQTANGFQRQFSLLLEEVTTLANGNVSNDFLQSEEIVTKNTLEAETKSSRLSGININTNITTRELALRSGRINANMQLLNRISDINRRTLPAIQNLIRFKENILKSVLSCELYTTNYPLLISHITNEARMYYKLLSKVERREPFTNDYINEQELFWNDIMKEHAQFIRGLLDPSEEELIKTANRFSVEYQNILDRYKNNPSMLLSNSLNETEKFKEFKTAGEEGILDCKIKSIIIPLLTDHVLREANHFIRILRSARQSNYNNINNLNSNAFMM